MCNRINVGLINGGTHEDRFCETVAIWAGSRIWERRGFMLDLIDPAALSLSEPHLHEDDEAVQALRRRLSRADAFVIVTPGQDRDIPSALGFVIDCADAEWEGKPVGFVACGDLSDDGPAVERLRHEFAQRQASILRDGIRLDPVHTRFDADGEPAASDPAHGAMDALLTQLQQWTLSRREPRIRQPCTKQAV